MTALHGLNDVGMPAYIPAFKSSGRMSAADAFMNEAAALEDADLDLRLGNGSKVKKVWGNAMFEGREGAATKGSLLALAPKEAFGSRAHYDRSSNHSLDTNRKNSPDKDPRSLAVAARNAAAPVVAKRVSRPLQPATPKEEDVPSKNEVIRVEPPKAPRAEGSPMLSIKRTLQRKKPAPAEAAMADQGTEMVPRQPKAAPAPVPKAARMISNENTPWEMEVKMMLLNKHHMEAVQRPGPPIEKGLVRCYVRRSKKMLSNYPTLMMHLEDGDTFLLAGRRRKKSTSSNFIISQDLQDLQRDSGNCIAKVKANFQGSEFMLWSRSEESSIRKGYGDQRLCLSFAADHGIKTSSPRVLHVVMPKLESGWRPAADSDDLQVYLRQAVKGELDPGVESRVHMMTTKQATYDPLKKAHSLDFGGRVKLPSPKNLQVVSLDLTGNRGSDVLLQFGKVEEDLYALDFGYPFTIDAAFAVALSVVDSKLCYAV